MALDLINILGHPPCEKKLIKEVKNHTPKLGESVIGRVNRVRNYKPWLKSMMKYLLAILM
jgi:exosome complex RNA-binding protein Csl4